MVDLYILKVSNMAMINNLLPWLLGFSWEVMITGNHSVAAHFVHIGWFNHVVGTVMYGCLQACIALM